MSHQTSGSTTLRAAHASQTLWHVRLGTPASAVAQGLEALVVDLRHQLASALSSRSSQHASAERADEAAENLAVQVNVVACSLSCCLAGFKVEGMFAP